jgi:hypothetical protein
MRGKADLSTIPFAAVSGLAEMTCSLVDPVSRHREIGHPALVAVQASYRILETSII